MRHKEEQRRAAACLLILLIVAQALLLLLLFFKALYSTSAGLVGAGAIEPHNVGQHVRVQSEALHDDRW